MKIVRVSRPDEERQLQALMLLRRSTPLSSRPASDLLHHPRCSPTGFEEKTAKKPTSQPVDQTRKDNDLPKEADDGNGRE